MATEAPSNKRNRKAKKLDRAVIRFAGDSGDGMQLTGMQFTAATAAAGNDLATLPEFPAEIRAPAGTLAGVSAFIFSGYTHIEEAERFADMVLPRLDHGRLRDHLG